MHFFNKIVYLKFLLLLLYLLYPSISVLGENEDNESKFNALFICNFAKFIQWPKDSSSTEFCITVYGDDPVIDELKRISNVTILGTKKIRIESTKDISRIGKTDIIFIPEHYSKVLPDIIEICINKPVLIVTNKKGLAEAGAGININNLYFKLRYEINLKYLSSHGLVAQDVLFKLGRVIE